ncbi:MAG TPA: 50S ribosomal protein L6 [Planctomycetota bacterium]|jgi:large subunit ribosomal protein L6|nr:50S ribosomal protein L6 [Planctomycetota bacterium]
MSRIGKKAIALPSKVTVEIDRSLVKVKGPKGEAAFTVDPEISVAVQGNQVVVSPAGNTKRLRAFHGLTRALINNMVVGVSTGFKTVLEIEGVGYTAKAESPTKLSMNIGFNAPVIMLPPEGVSVATPKNTVIEITGIDRQKVGQFAANVRAVRPPEPYKGKGIRYQGEIIRRKAGKAIGGKG